MKVRILPGIAKGSVKVPSSKSVGHRALICAALAKGTSTVTNIGYSKDIYATVESLKALGAKIEITGDTAVVIGCNPFEVEEKTVMCDESGSTLRFMIPLFSLNEKTHIFTGKGRLLSRPQDIYQKLFDDNGNVFKHMDDSIEARGPLKAGEYFLDGSISSQFFTGLLFALPLLDGDSVIHIGEPFESRSYVNITIDVLSKFGIDVSLVGNDLFIKGNQSYVARDYEVEGDYSSAAFFGLLGAINSKIEIQGLGASLQGDKVFFDYMKQLGAKVEENDGSIVVSPGEYQDVCFDLKDCPDLGPALMTAGAFTGKKMTLNNIARLRFKESDRVKCVFDELSKVGADLKCTDNEAYISSSIDKESIDEYVFDGHNDHRIVMSLAVLATVLDKPSVINGAEAIAKSYPSFFDDLRSTGISVEVLND